MTHGTWLRINPRPAAKHVCRPPVDDEFRIYPVLTSGELCQPGAVWMYGNGTTRRSKETA